MTTEVGKDIDRAAHFLAQDQLVAIPTETVYGLAADALHAEAIEQIYAVKQRPLHNPLILHLGIIDDLDRYVTDIPAMAYALAERFWPGPLTLLLPRRSGVVPDILTAGLPDVAVRIPKHPMTLELLRQIDFPLAAPSANPFGYISPTTPAHVLDQLGGKIPYILDGGPCDEGIESTIVGFDGELPIVYRHGAVPTEAIRALTGEIGIRARKTHAPVAPGMLPWHYSPHTRLIFTDRPAEILAELPKGRHGLLAFRAPVSSLPQEDQVILSPAGDLTEAARNLYAALHRLDAMGLDVIVAEQVPAEGIGIAINDRLARASTPKD